jgi:hypothetical protein
VEVEVEEVEERRKEEELEMSTKLSPQRGLVVVGFLGEKRGAMVESWDVVVVAVICIDRGKSSWVQGVSPHYKRCTLAVPYAARLAAVAYYSYRRVSNRTIEYWIAFNILAVVLRGQSILSD